MVGPIAPGLSTWQASGDTALHFAVMAGSMDAVRALLDLGFDKHIVNKARLGKKGGQGRLVSESFPGKALAEDLFLHRRTVGGDRGVCVYANPACACRRVYEPLTSRWKTEKWTQ